MVPEEEKLIESVKLGNANSYRILVDQYKDMVYSLCIRMVKNSMLAEEVAQDAFVKAYRNIGSYRNESKFSTWLYRIVFNTCISSLRKNKVIEVDFEDQAYGSESNSGLDTLIEEDRNKMLSEVISRLKGEDQVIIQLFYLEELSIKEIVEVTNLSEANVKVKLHRVKLKMKGYIEDDYPELKRVSAH